MPYKSTKDLPQNLRDKLPAGAEKAYMSAFNSAKAKDWEESRAHSYAWGAVKRNYRKSGDKWVKKAMTNEEKKMLHTAKKIRKLVAADFMEKTANPAIAAVGRALLPALRQLGPKVLGMLKNIPPDVWAQIIPHLVGTLTQGMGQGQGQGQGARAASATPPSVEFLEKRLHSAKVKHPQELARLLALAVVKTRNKHQKKANPEVTEAIRLVRRMEAELQTLKDFS